MSPQPVYLDYQATTPVAAEVMATMAPFFTTHFGNAASKGHSYGWTAEAAADLAREKIAELVLGRSNEVIFTSGATEANNLAILGALNSHESGGARHVVTVATEHKAVLDPVLELESRGFRVTRLVPSDDGLVSAQQVADAVSEDTLLVSVMHANNEIGVIQPMAEIGAAVKAKNASCLFHSDCAQSAGRLVIDVDGWHLDLVSLSAHKMYGPKGVGALWMRRRPKVHLEPLTFGGGHERGLRPGTLPVPLLVGFGKAAEIAMEQRDKEGQRLSLLRDDLAARLLENSDRVTVNGHREKRLPNNLNISVEGVLGEALLLAVAPEIAVSSGAACTSAQSGPSHVLLAIGCSKDAASASLRISLGRETSQADIDTAFAAISGAILKLS